VRVRCWGGTRLADDSCGRRQVPTTRQTGVAQPAVLTWCLIAPFSHHRPGV
jgi:hypothetical protein